MKRGGQVIVPSAPLHGRRDEKSWGRCVDFSPLWRMVFNTRAEFSILHVGCGGTGSFLSGSLARLAHTARRTGLTLDVVFIDPDTVTEANVGRQNFCPADVGRPKAEALSERYNRAYGWNSTAVVEHFKVWANDHKANRHIGGLVVGCVDTAAARREIAEWIQGAWGGWFWLDLGNHRLSGQVLFGNLARKIGPPDRVEGVRLLKGLPLPSFQHPDLLQDEPQEAGSAILAAPAFATRATQRSPASQSGKPATAGEGRSGTASASCGRSDTPTSCAARIERGEQGLFVNQMAAAVGAEYLYDMLVTGEMRRFATYFDLESGSMRSLATTEANLRRFSRRERKQDGSKATPLQAAAA
ncbi:MAG: ThiF family adenylyltransferase [Nitrospirae bacterium]|nr:ThiF family adenylyltransferase [Nitrospirota bacterium]